MPSLGKEHAMSTERLDDRRDSEDTDPYGPYHLALDPEVMDAYLRKGREGRAEAFGELFYALAHAPERLARRLVGSVADHGDGAPGRHRFGH